MPPQGTVETLEAVIRAASDSATLAEVHQVGNVGWYEDGGVKLAQGVVWIAGRLYAISLEPLP